MEIRINKKKLIKELKRSTSREFDIEFTCCCESNIGKKTASEIRRRAVTTAIDLLTDSEEVSSEIDLATLFDWLGGGYLTVIDSDLKINKFDPEYPFHLAVRKKNERIHKVPT